MDEQTIAAILLFNTSVIMPAAAAAMELNDQSRKRRVWARKILLKRKQLGYGETLCKELLHDRETWFNFTRMTIEQFNDLLTVIGSSLTKFSIRQPISERERLLVTLRFLATGDNYSSIGYSFRISKKTVHNIVKETTQLIWEHLNEKYIPRLSEEDLKKIADEYYEVTKLPNCIGAIDGKHCVIQAPPNSGSLYFNYKKTFSIVLLAVCDSNYNFTYVNVGAYGSESDGGILRRSTWGTKLLNSELPLPEDSLLPNSQTLFPYFFVGDEAFPLKRHLLRPFAGRALSAEKRLFNTYLSKARRHIENTFGILVSKFRIFHTVICAQPELAKSIINCAVVLHNYIRKTKPMTRNLQQSTDTDIGRWRQYRNDTSVARPTHEAQEVRDILTNYLNTNQ